MRTLHQFRDADRILQGLLGGGLLAKGQSILFETFPPSEQGIAQAVFGVSMISGPAIGPTLGGYLTDTLGWRWIFFANLPVGILAVLMAIVFLPADRPQPANVARVDWWGIALLTIALGSLQTFLEEGESENWFESQFVVTLLIAAMIGLALFIWRELSTRHPAVDLRVLRYRSLAAGSLFSMVVGVGLYGTLFVLPIYAQQTVLHFTAMQTGLMLLPGALTSAIAMLTLGRITAKVDARLLIAIGSLLTALVMFNLATININTGKDNLFWPLVFRGAAIVLMFLPLTLATLSPLPKADIPAGTGFYNLTRQLGGSIGIAILATVLDRREAFHRAVLSDGVSLYNGQTQSRMQAMTSAMQSQGTDATTAHQQALALLSQTVDLQAILLAFEDMFRIVGWVFICCLPLVLLLGKGNTKPAPGGH